MAPDDYQQAWQADATRTRITIDADMLQTEVQRAERDFRAVIFWRDAREIGLAILMLPGWIFFGVWLSLPWTWYLTVPVLVWYAVFMLTYRMRHQRKPSQPAGTLLDCVKESMTQVEHQIWLLRNVFWWALLPVSISAVAFIAHCAWLSQTHDWSAAAFFGVIVVVVALIMAALHFLNQTAVASTLEPRRQELLTLLASLSDETICVGEQTFAAASVSRVAKKPPKPCTSQASLTAACLVLAFGALLLASVVLVASWWNPIVSWWNTDDLRKSPFAAVRWQEYQPEVRLAEEWFRLVSLNDLPAAEIVAFSRRTYGNLWRKRFEEDLVELLTAMKNPPQDKVTLVVRSLSTSETWVRESVLMTSANRSAIRRAARTRVIPEPQRQPVQRSGVSIDNTGQFRERVDEFLHRAHVQVGFSGVVAVAQAGQPVYEGEFGFSHLAARTPNSLDTPFRIAALSQPFTAAAILSLEAERKLSTDDPVHRYLPDFAAEPYRGITIYHLLTHSSGLPRIPEGVAQRARWSAMSKAPTRLDDYVRLACQCPLKFEPGQDRQYTNIGYRILSAIIVRITGQEYADFMEQRLFRPLWLSQTGVARISQSPDESNVAEVVSLVPQNSRNPRRYVRSDSGQNYGAEYGNAGIYTSARDLLRWDRFLAGNSFLSAEQRAKLFRPFRKNYACGWIVATSEQDGRLYQVNTGANAGYFSRMMRIPEDDLVIIALGNVRKTDEIDEALEQLFRLCRSLPYQEL